MKHDEPEIIARRQLERDGRAYEVLIERPHRQGPIDNFACRWSLVDDADAVVMSYQMYGVDSAQALTEVILLIDSLLGRGFTAYGNEGTGFPQYLPVGVLGMSGCFYSAWGDAESMIGSFSESDRATAARAAMARKGRRPDAVQPLDPLGE